MELSDSGPPTILIVEDIVWIRSSMKKSLERYGYRALEAADDVEAIEVAEQSPPELILTEEKLPTLGALTASLRAHPRLCNLPLVIVNPDAEEGARLGDAFVLTGYDRIASLLASSRE